MNAPNDPDISGLRINVLQISGTNPRIRLRFANASLWIYRDVEDREMSQVELDKADLLYLRVKEFVDEHRTWRSRAIPWLILLLPAVFGADLATPVGNGREMTVTVTVSSVLILAVGLMVTRARIGNGYVTLESKTTATTFWQRKKDDIILQIGILVVGAVLGVIGTLIAQHFAKYQV